MNTIPALGQRVTYPGFTNHQGQIIPAATLSVIRVWCFSGRWYVRAIDGRGVVRTDLARMFGGEA